MIKDYTYKVKKGAIKHILHTNLQVIEPTEYLITYPTTLTILEYKVNEISNKPFYIKEHNQKYNLKENNKPLYATFLMKNELTNHLVSVSNEEKNRLNILMEQYKNYDKLLSEKSKMNNQLEWVKLMNNYKNIAEEVILKELIYIENV